jgi:hypothetical protein
MTVNPASTLEFKREVDIKVSFQVETSGVGCQARQRRHVRTVVDDLVLDKTSGPVQDRGWRIEAQVE